MRAENPARRLAARLGQARRHPPEAHVRKQPRHPQVRGPAPEGCGWSEGAARKLSVPARVATWPWRRQRGFSLG